MALIGLLLPEVYSATISFVPPIEILHEEPELTGGLGVRQSSILGRAIGDASIADMCPRILRSRALIDAIGDQFDLMTVYEQKKYKSRVGKELRKKTTIKVSNEGVVTIIVEDRDPNQTAMANVRVDELDRQNKRLSAGRATSRRIFLENR